MSPSVTLADDLAAAGGGEVLDACA